MNAPIAKLLILADSLALADEESAEESTYPYHLSGELGRRSKLHWATYLSAERNCNSKSLLKRLDTVDGRAYNVAIFQIGTVDCFPRLFPSFAYRISGRLPAKVRKALVAMGKQLRDKMGDRYPNFRGVSPTAARNAILTLVGRLTCSLIIIVGPSPAYMIVSKPHLRDNIDAHYEALNDLQEESVLVVDLRELFQNSPERWLRKDGVHLSPIGHIRLATYLADRILTNSPLIP